MSEVPLAGSAKTETDAVAVLSAIWCELLQVEGVNESDNFLELGGDSVTAILYRQRVRKALSVDMPLALLMHSEGSFQALVAHVANQPALGRQDG